MMAMRKRVSCNGQQRADNSIAGAYPGFVHRHSEDRQNGQMPASELLQDLSHQLFDTLGVLGVEADTHVVLLVQNPANFGLAGKRTEMGMFFFGQALHEAGLGILEFGDLILFTGDGAILNAGCFGVEVDTGRGGGELVKVGARNTSRDL